MIVQPTVELTKVHYYRPYISENAGAISTISGRESNTFSHHTIIKNNIFGHRWVLKINEPEDGGASGKKSSKIRLILYVLVFCCIVLAVAFGIFFSLEPYFHNNTTLPKRFPDTVSNNCSKTPSIRPPGFKVPGRQQAQSPINQSTSTTIRPRKICMDCPSKTHICLKTFETEKPQCLQALDQSDPTGCGGFCQINTQFCQLLDSHSLVYQCSEMRTILHCPSESFNCGNRCISMEKRCDGTIHCSTNLDEENCSCNLTTHFHCGNRTSCLDKTRRCDGRIDCWDKSDEINCLKGPPCGLEELACLSGECISKEQFCDGVYHCHDKSDEPSGCDVKFL